MVLKNSRKADLTDEDVVCDSVCAICDNGGSLLCCEGPCRRAFHGSKGDDGDGRCLSLGFTTEEVEKIDIFLCKNCKYRQHQCFACGNLGSSDMSDAEVYKCVHSNCGHFYHPKCASGLLFPDDGAEALKCEKGISDSLPFECPVHRCFLCKFMEGDPKQGMEFAVCRRCPRSYHRKCLPRKIGFEPNYETGTDQRAWEGLLPNQILIYCRKHPIDVNLGTPVRNHIKFPDGPRMKKDNVGQKEKLCPPSMSKLASNENLVGNFEAKSPNSIARTAEDYESLKSWLRSSRDETALKNKKILTRDKACQFTSTVTDSQRRIPLPARKLIKVGAALKKGLKTSQHGVGLQEDSLNTNQQRSLYKSEATIGQVCKKLRPQTKPANWEMPSAGSKSLKKRLRKHQRNADVQEKQVSPEKQKVVDRLAVENTCIKRSAKRAKLHEGLPSENVSLMNETKSSQHNASDEKKMLLTKNQGEKMIASCPANSAHLHKRNAFTTTNASSGRPQMAETLVEAAERLFHYVQDGDTILDFFTGAGNLSQVMKEKLEGIGKRYNYHSHGIMDLKNNCTAGKDWSKDLPTGSKLLIFFSTWGVREDLVNIFLEKALTIKPKLILVAASEDANRLDQLKSIYNLIWTDGECSPRRPCSVDSDARKVEQCSSPLLLNMWSRTDWTAVHHSTGMRHGHLSQTKDFDDAKRHYQEPVTENCAKGGFSFDETIIHCETLADHLLESIESSEDKGDTCSEKKDEGSGMTEDRQVRDIKNAGEKRLRNVGESEDRESHLRAKKRKVQDHMPVLEKRIVDEKNSSSPHKVAELDELDEQPVVPEKQSQHGTPDAEQPWAAPLEMLNKVFHPMMCFAPRPPEPIPGSTCGWIWIDE